ncbi:hypothetical protein HG535_0A07890 [Zygotorulaspora mrakii]|uniref:Iron transporter FTH1 n=1 Tax=Zygotorulaspora mrakii TaxID=42260 RepID=A0A7H9AX12_ZYGMR|nr:uncharacterized protein HG535_0A07890 [Zygotorulaspora mrakii]QLG70846.1 hypothetical protein HG535_0A07890 [Zygotorulaspora mrakii]
MGFENYFSFQIFFIFLRESLEIVVIISILLTIVRQALSISDDEDDSLTSSSGPGSAAQSMPLTLEEEEEVYEFSEQLRQQNQDQTQTHTNAVENSKLYSKLKVQIISGGALGLLICLVIGGAFIVVFYHIGTDLWSASEHYYEGALSLIASVIISVMGLFFLRMGKLREKFRIKLASIIYSDKNMLKNVNGSKAAKFSERYAFFILPFITALREGLEAVVFIGGVGLDQPLSSIPLSMASAAIISGFFGYFFFRYSGSLSLKICLVVATCFLYLIAAGLFSKGVWQLEVQDYVNKCNGQDMAEVGNGPGSYDISRSVWHVNCCNGERDGLWMILTAIFGWTNSATYGSVISYNLYWLAIIIVIRVLKTEEHGYISHLPLFMQKRRLLKRLNIAKASLELKSSSAKHISSPLSAPRNSEDSSTPLVNGQIEPSYALASA